MKTVVQRRFHESNMKLLSTSDIAAQPDLFMDRLFQYISQSHPNTNVGCTRYSDLNGKKEVWMPLFLADPSYRSWPSSGDNVEYWRFLRYGTSSGNAAGNTLVEAILHSIFEVIERDSVSLLLMRRYLSQQMNLKVVPTEALPLKIQTLIKQLTNVTQGPVYVFDITTSLGIPTYIAYSGSQRYPSRLIGSGSSLDPYYAIERAVSELYQLVILYKWGESDITDIRFGERLRRWPNLYQAYVTALDINSDGSLSPLSSVTPQTTLYPDTPEEALKEVVQRLSQHGLDVFYRVLSDPSLPVTVVHVCIPGTERFYLARHGQEVIPTGRPIADNYSV